MMLFQGVDLPLDVNRAWEISPYNGAAFGALVVVLGLIAYYFMRQAEKKQEYINTIISKVHELSDATVEKLHEIRDNAQAHQMQNEQIKSQNDKLIYILEDVKRRLEMIDKNGQ